MFVKRRFTILEESNATNGLGFTVFCNVDALDPKGCSIATHYKIALDIRRLAMKSEWKQQHTYLSNVVLSLSLSLS
jgi:hypothetical protein